MSQTTQILEHLETGAALTPLEALERFGCFRLAARIDDLRNMGHPINTHKQKTSTGKTIASYRMAVRKKA